MTGLEVAWEAYRPRAAEHDATPCRLAFTAGWEAAYALGLLDGAAAEHDRVQAELDAVRAAGAAAEREARRGRKAGAAVERDRIRQLADQVDAFYDAPCPDGDPECVHQDTPFSRLLDGGS
jgi:hypothetical protein